MNTVLLGVTLALGVSVSTLATISSAFQVLTRQRFDEQAHEEAVRLARRPGARRALRMTCVAAEVATLVAAAFVFPATGALWFGIMAAVVAALVFVELTGRAAGRRWYHGLTRNSRLLVWLLFEVTRPLRWAVDLVMSTLSTVLRIPLGAPDEGLDEDELLDLLDNAEVEEHERDIIEAFLEFDAITVERLMTPRPAIATVPSDLSWEQLLDAVKDLRFSRIPVHGGRPDDIVGLLLIKDLLANREHPPDDVSTMFLEPVFVPATKKAQEMLRAFLSEQFHMAFVVDEHGVLVGLVTIDDLLEQVVGELEDDDTVTRTHHGSTLVRGDVDTDDFYEQSGIKLPEGEYHTVGGFLFHQLGRLPVEGDVLDWEDYRFTVASMEGRRIEEVRVERSSSRSSRSSEVRA